MNKLAIGLVVLLLLMLIIAIYMFWPVKTIAVTSANNVFQIGLCGSCSGAAKPIGADVTGLVTPGNYTPAALASALMSAMNVTTQAVSTLPNEWTVAYNPTTKTFGFVSNTQRSWTFKTIDHSIYATIGMTPRVDKFWMFWNGTAALSTSVGNPITI